MKDDTGRCNKEGAEKTCPTGVTTCPAGNHNQPQRLVAATTSELTRLACLWSQQELCGRRPAKVDPFAWACHGTNLDSFLLFVRLKQLPKVPTFREAVVQQQKVFDEEAGAVTHRKEIADHLVIQLPAVGGTPPAGSCSSCVSAYSGGRPLVSSASQRCRSCRSMLPRCCWFHCCTCWRYPQRDETTGPCFVATPCR